MFDRATKLRQAEKLRDKLSEQTARAEDRKHLAEVIEQYVGKGAASLP